MPSALTPEMARSRSTCQSRAAPPPGLASSQKYDQSFEGGLTSILLQEPGDSVYLLPLESDSSWYWLVSARNGPPSIAAFGATIFLADPIWGGPVNALLGDGDWTSAQHAAAAFLASLSADEGQGGGTIVYPAGTLQFGSDSTEVPGCLLPPNVLHVGAGREATLIVASSDMTANLMSCRRSITAKSEP
jgi:hypothetical protein